MRIARCAILGVFCLSGIQSAISAAPPAQGRGAGQISARGLDRARFSPEVSRALENRARVETGARVDARGNVGGIGQASAAGEARVGAQFGTGRLGGESSAAPAERGPGRRNVLDRFSRRERREDRPDRMDRPVPRQNPTSRGRSDERPRRGLFSAFLSTRAEAAVNGREETENENDDDSGERWNRGNRRVNPQDRGFRPTAEWLLNKRLARIDHLRDVALANGNTRLMEKADELEALARLQYEHRTGGTGDDPVGDDPVGDDPVSDDPVVDDPVLDDPIGDDPVLDDPVTDDPVTDDPISDDPVADDPVETDLGFSEPMTLGFEEFSTLDTTTTTSDATLDASTEFRGSGRFGRPSGPANGTGFSRFEQSTAFEGETAPFDPVPGREFGMATSESARMQGRDFGLTTRERARAEGRAFGHSIADSVRYRPSEPEEETTQTFRASANTGIEAEGRAFGSMTSEEARRLRSEFGFATQESARISGREFGATTSGTVRGSGGF